jgi:hypothetical protein
MKLIGDVLSGVLVFVFGSAAIAKVARQKAQVRTADKLRIPWERYRLIGVPEGAAAAGLLIGFASAPFGVAAAIGLILLMLGALALRIRVRDGVGYLLGDTALLGLAAAVVALRI